MLVQAVVQRSSSGSGDGSSGGDGDGGGELAALVEVQKLLTKGAQKCNNRLRALEDHARMEELANQLDFSRIVKPVPLLHSGRTLIKEGRLQLVKLDSKGKVSKRKVVQLVRACVRRAFWHACILACVRSACVRHA
jgi:hypothetical protein